MVQFCRIHQSDSKTFIHRVLDPYFRALVEHGKCKENLHIENTLEIELLIKISDIGHRHNGSFHHTTRRQQIFFRTFVTHTHTYISWIKYFVLNNLMQSFLWTWILGCSLFLFFCLFLVRLLYVQQPPTSTHLLIFIFND